MKDTVEMILKMTSMVYSAIEVGFEEAETEVSKDTLNVIFTAVDNGIIEIASGLLAAAWTSKEAKIEMSSLGEITIEAASLNEISLIESRDAQSPSLSIQQNLLNMKIAGVIPDAVDFLKEAIYTPITMARDAKEDAKDEKEAI
jgi:hypothetical protein